MASLVSLATVLYGFHLRLQSVRITDRSPCPPGMYRRSGDLNSAPLTCVASKCYQPDPSEGSFVKSETLWWLTEGPTQSEL